MILLVDGGSDSVWLPVYTLNEDHECLYLILGALELVSYLLTAALVLKSCRIVHNSRHFHENMNLLVVSLLLQWFEAFCSKLIIMPYQVGILTIGDPAKVYVSWWTSDSGEMIRVPSFFSILALYVPGMLIWHYIYSMFMGVTCVAVERIFATYYIRDYEKTPRNHIGIGLILLVHFISFPFSYFMVNNRIHFVIADSLCIAVVILVCVIYTSVWLANDRLRRSYRLAQQFQVKENIRHIMLARNIVCCATFFVAIACSLLMIIVLDVIPAYLKNPLAHCVENCIFLNPLLICTVMLWSVPTWKKELLGWIPIVGRIRNKPRAETGRTEESRTTGEETEVYFNQFRNAWV